MKITTYSLKMDSTQRILMRRGLDADGRVQRFFITEVARMADPYVPMDDGHLKNTKRIYPSYIHYPQNYAKRQYKTNRGLGKEGVNRGSGKRGARWIERMWRDHGNQIINSVARFAGVRGK